MRWTRSNWQQLIVGQAVTQETNDKKQLMPMIMIIEEQSGITPTQLLADAGYCSDENLAAIADTPIDAYISTRKQKQGERPGPCPRGPLAKPATWVDRMSRKLHRKVGAAVSARRSDASPIDLAGGHATLTGSREGIHYGHSGRAARDYVTITAITRTGS